ncbi:MAG TPA: sulfotransferase [Solirubrobacteraceae bacterium]
MSNREAIAGSSADPGEDCLDEAAPAPRTGPQALRPPEFFIVGQPKSGTTALYEMLRRHPQIFMPENKEPWFFADELRERMPPRPGGTPETLEQYLELFEPAAPGQLRGEASTLYLWSRTAAGRIAAVQPDAKIIAILREPASLLRSLHLQFLRSHVEVETDFRRAIALEEERRDGRSVPRNTYWPSALMYSEHVRYVEQLQRYREAFGAEQMLILIYDDFRSDNEAAVRAVLRFLEADDTAPVEVLEANTNVGVRSRHLHALANAVSLGRGPLARSVKAVVRALMPPSARRSAKRRVLYREPPLPDEAFMRELRTRFEPEVRALSAYLDRDLVTLWGNEPVA